MNDITKSLDYIRTLQKQEKAQENSDLWAAILAIVDALEAANITVPEIHAQKAQESLLRARRHRLRRPFRHPARSRRHRRQRQNVERRHGANL